MHPILFHIPLSVVGLGNIPVFAYGFMMMLGFLSAITLASRLGRQEEISADRIYDLSFIAIVSGVIGSRIMWVIQESSPESIQSLTDYIAVWQGGLVYYGGLLFGLPVCAIYIRLKKLPFGATLDCFAPAIALGLAFGRIGCLLNGCCYGGTCKADAWYSLQFPAGSPAAYHHHGIESGHALQSLAVFPAQPLSSLAALTILILLLTLRPYRRFKGQLMLHFLQLYGVARFFLEVIRDDTPTYLGFSGFQGFHPGQIVAILTFFIATLLLAVLLKKNKGVLSHEA